MTDLQPPSHDGTLRNVNLAARVEDLERAIRIIADALYDEAIDRDWCSEYNEFVTNVNKRLPNDVQGLQHLNRTFTVSFHVEIPDSSALSGLERNIDGWLADHDLNSCTDFEMESE